MRWSACRGVAVLAVALTLACSTDRGDQESKGGFEGDTRPTFQEDDPYEDVSKVEWRAWSDDVITSSTKPILLDLSGSWCHFCHIYDVVVYGADDFSTFINENFTPVRVDADRRPDIDARYNQGGWPSLVVLTPEGYPVAGTGFDVSTIGTFLRSSLARYQAGGDSLRQALATSMEELSRRQPFLQEQCDLDAGLLGKVVPAISRYFDSDYGGFRSSDDEQLIKYAAPEVLEDLIEDVTDQETDVPVEPFLVRTLDGMAGGAIHDPLFGGFFRTVEDRAWTRPHFEKLLDVQAAMAELYLAAYERWNEPRYRDVAIETIDFALEFLGNPDDVTFASSMDGDVGPSDQGSFYTWTVAELDELLSPDEAAAIKYYYGVAEAGEMPYDVTQNTLFPHADIARVAERFEIGEDEARARIESARARMRASRLAGDRPRVDTRAYAAENLKMAAAMLHASQVVEGEAYRARALAIIDFFASTHLDPGMGVPHAFDGETVAGPWLLSSQVSAIEACLAAHEVTDDPEYLAKARQIQRIVAGAYRNELTGACWDVPASTWGVGLLKTKVRPLEENVRLASTFMDVTERTGDQDARQQAEQILKAFCVSYDQHGLMALPYATAVHRLSWKLRAKSS